VLLAPLCDGSAGGDDTDDPWTVLEVAAGRDASGARCRGGALFLWGDNAAGRLGVAMRDGAFHEAAKGAGGGGGGGGGGRMAVAAADAVPAPAQVLFPAGSRVVAFALGYEHAVALVADDNAGGNGNISSAPAVYSWGNPGPWLGRPWSTACPAACPSPVQVPNRPPATDRTSDPTAPDPVAVPVAAACGERHTVVVTSDGGLLTCGAAAAGQLGGPRLVEALSAGRAAANFEAGGSAGALRWVAGFGPGGQAGSTAGSEAGGGSEAGDGEAPVVAAARWAARGAVAGSNHTAVLVGRLRRNELGAPPGTAPAAASHLPKPTPRSSPRSAPPPPSPSQAADLAAAHVAEAAARVDDGRLSAAEFEAEARAWVQWRWPPHPAVPAGWAPEWVWHSPRSGGNSGGVSLRLPTGYLSLKRPLQRWAPTADCGGGSSGGSSSRGGSAGNESAEGSEWAWEEDGVAVADEHTLTVLADRTDGAGGGASAADDPGGSGTAAPNTQAFACEQEWFVDVTYSPTWRVPLLCFTAQRCARSDGGRQGPLAWADLAPLLPRALGDDLGGGGGSSGSEVGGSGGEPGAWPLVTEELHPATGLPCFTLHPCATAARMASLLQSRKCPSTAAAAAAPSNRGDGRYLLAWLAMVGPAVGLAVSPCFFANRFH
jgi:hypothetical protein